MVTVTLDSLLAVSSVRMPYMGGRTATAATTTAAATGLAWVIGSGFCLVRTHVIGQLQRLK